MSLWTLANGDIDASSQATKSQDLVEDHSTATSQLVKWKHEESFGNPLFSDNRIYGGSQLEAVGDNLSTQGSQLVKWKPEESFGNPLFSDNGIYGGSQLEAVGDNLSTQGSQLAKCNPVQSFGTPFFSANVKMDDSSCVQVENPYLDLSNSLSGLQPATEAHIEPVFELYHGITRGSPKAHSHYSTYRAIPVASQKHRRIVYIYVIPSNNAQCYVFNFKRSLANGSSYVCRGCEGIRLKNRGDNKAVKINNPSLRVINGFFAKDPESLNHVCTPKDTAHSLVSRKVTALNARLRKTDDRRAPLLLQQEVLDEAFNDPDYQALSPSQQRRGAARLLYGKKGLSHFPRTIQRNRMRVKERHTALKPGNLDLQSLPYIADDSKCVLLDTDRLVVVIGKEILLSTVQTGQLECFICDGRFKQKPAPFVSRSSQVYTVHCKLRTGHHFPILQAYASDATKTTYLTIFRFIRKFATEAGILSAIVNAPAVFDYERGAMSAWKEAIGGSVHGCYFHWTKAVIAHRKDVGLEVAFKENQRFRSWFRRLLKIPFATRSTAMAAEGLLAPESSGLSGEEEGMLTKFLAYLEETWFGPTARFPEVWEAVKNPYTMTSNVAEGYHTRVKTYFSNERRPPLSEYLRFITSEFVNASYVLGALHDGSLPEPYIRPKNRERRDKTVAAASAFHSFLNHGTPSSAEVLMYLEYLASVN